MNLPDLKRLKAVRNKRLGSSIEEVIVRRKFDSTDPISWPEPSPARRQFSQSIPRSIGSNGIRDLNFGERTAVSSKGRLMPYEHGQEDGKWPTPSLDDKDKILNKLMDYCRSLQDRVQELESQVVRSTGKARNSTSPDHARSFGHDLALSDNESVDSFSGKHRKMVRIGGSVDLEPSIDSEDFAPKNGKQKGRHASVLANAKVSKMISVIDSKVGSLKEIFRKGDPLDERRQAATKIAATIRGYLARAHLTAYMHGIREWKWLRARPLVHVLDILLSNQSSLDAGIQLQIMNRQTHTLRVVFSKWCIVCKQNAPMRKSILIAAEERIAEKRKYLVRAVFTGFVAVTIGHLSRRNANKQRRLLIESIRADLSRKLLERGLIGVVPEDDITRTLYRRVLEQFLAKKRMLSIKSIFDELKKILVKSRRNYQAGVKQRFKVLAGACFYAWSDYTYLQAIGLDRRRWIAPRQYEIRYNQKRVDNFSKVRCKRFVFRAWKLYFGVQFKVKVMYQKKLAQFLGNIFHAWRTESSKQHSLRVLTFDNWKAYPRVMMTSPFRAWASFVKALKGRFDEQMRICNTYVRWKWRKKLLVIMKAWRHFALFGRIDGLYSRQMLLKSLAEQKTLVSDLEKTMSEQTLELEDCKTVVTHEITKRQDLESKFTNALNDVNTLKMKNHHYEQEIRRLESVIQSMMEINPHQVEHIKKSQPNFKFKERNIVLPKESKSKSKKKDSTRAKEPGAGVIASFDENEGNNYVGDYPAGNKSISPQFGDEQGKKTVKNPAVSMSSDSGDNIGELIKTPSFQSPNRGHLTQQISQSSMMSRQSSVMGSIDERESEDDEGRSRLTSQSDDKGKSFDDGDLINSISAYKNELSESIGEVNLAGSDPNNKTMDESISVDIVHPASQVSNDLQQQQYQHQALDESTILLLDRANWLIDRFQDAQKYVFAVHNSQKEHTQSSLELLSQPVNLSLLSKEPQEFAARGTANRATVSIDYSQMASRPPLLRAPSHVDDEEEEFDDGQPVHLTITTHNENGEDDEQSCTSPRIDSAEQLIAAAISATVCPEDAKSGIPAYYDGLMSNGTPTPLIHTMVSLIQKHPLAGAELIKDLLSAAKIVFAFINFLSTGDITNFTVEDKKSWVLHLLEVAMEEDAKSRPAIRELQKPEEKSTNLAVQQLLNQIDTGESMSPKSIAQAARKEAASIPRVEVIKAVDPEAVVVSDTTLGKTIGEGKECATSGEEVVEVTSSLGKLPDDVKVAKELIIIDSTPTADIGPGHETWRESLLKLRTLYPGGGNYSGVGMDTDTVDDLGMFERILQMRDDLNKAVERQVIKHQNVMLQQNWNLDVRAIHSSNNIPLGTINDEDETVDYNPSAQMGYMGGYVDPSTNVYSSNLRTEPEVSKSQDDSNMSDDLTDDGTN